MLGQDSVSSAHSMTLKATPEFETFALWFYQDLDIESGTEAELFAHVLRPFKGEARARLRAFLIAASCDSVTDAELLDLWSASQSDWNFRTGAGVRAMFRRAAELLVKEGPRPKSRVFKRPPRTRRR